MPYAVAILLTDRASGTPPQVTAARALMVEHFGREPDVADGEFVPVASVDGALPYSAWWMATFFEPALLTLAQQFTAQFPGSRVEAYDNIADPLRPQAILAEMGMKPLSSFP